MVFKIRVKLFVYEVIFWCLRDLIIVLMVIGGGYCEILFFN